MDDKNESSHDNVLYEYLSILILEGNFVVVG